MVLGKGLFEYVQMSFLHSKQGSSKQSLGMYAGKDECLSKAYTAAKLTQK